MSQRNPDDLSSLVDAASKEATRSGKARVPLREGAAQRPFRTLAMLVLAVAAVFSAYGIWTRIADPSAAKVSADLGQAIDLARASVEEVRKNTGALPETLPNASLASVVNYERRNTDYRLSASVVGVRVTIGWDGSKNIDMESGK